jgi:hypothetical protein
MLVAVGGVAAAVWFTIDSFNPEHYFRYAHRATQEPWSHPTGAVVLVALFTVLEAWLFYVVFHERRESSIWMRALIGLIILAPWCVFITMFVMHAPGFILLHARWVWSLLLVLVVIFVVSGSGALMRARQARMSDPGNQAG